MDLHHVEAHFHRQLRRPAEALGDLLNFAGGQAGDVGPYLLVQQGAQLLHGDPFGEHTGDVFEHGLDVGIRLVELGAEQAALGVDGVDHGPVPGSALFGVEGGAEAVGQHRHISQDDHGAAPRGDLPQPLQLLFLGQAQGGGGKNNPVF